MTFENDVRFYLVRHGLHNINTMTGEWGFLSYAGHTNRAVILDTDLSALRRDLEALGAVDLVIGVTFDAVASKFMVAGHLYEGQDD